MYVVHTRSHALCYVRVILTRVVFSRVASTYIFSPRVIITTVIFTRGFSRRVIFARVASTRVIYTRVNELLFVRKHIIRTITIWKRIVSTCVRGLIVELAFLLQTINLWLHSSYPENSSSCHTSLIYDRGLIPYECPLEPVGMSNCIFSFLPRLELLIER